MASCTGDSDEGGTSTIGEGGVASRTGAGISPAFGSTTASCAGDSDEGRTSTMGEGGVSSRTGAGTSSAVVWLEGDVRSLISSVGGEEGVAETSMGVTSTSGRICVEDVGSGAESTSIVSGAVSTVEGSSTSGTATGDAAAGTTSDSDVTSSAGTSLDSGVLDTGSGVFTGAADCKCMKNKCYKMRYFKVTFNCWLYV